MSSKKLNLAECRQECFDCIKAYKQKHSLVKGDKFSIPCTGIPSEYITDEVLAGLGEDTEIAICSQDPVEWAKHFLDWHCLDPKGEIWARKTQEGTLGELPLYNHAQAQAGKSIFHRPYQSTMLSCSSRRKVFRLGRQSGKTEVLCIAMLFHLWNHENFKIIVIAPYQSQIDLIFTRVTNLLRSNTILSNSIERSVKAPNYQIKLKNGSQVSGFTAGSRSGGNADAARGQSASMLCFTSGTLINTLEYATRPIESLTLNNTVLGGNAEEIFVGDILGLYKQKSKVISISTPLTSMNLTPEHPLFNGKVDVPAKDAKDVVVSLSHQEISFREDAILARLAGYNFGDGYVNPVSRTAYFFGEERDLEQIVEDINYLGGRYCHGVDRDSINEELQIIGTCATIGSRWAWRLLKDSCPAGKKVYQELRVPEWIKLGHPTARRNFLSGLFSAEGSSLRYQLNGKTPCAIELRMTSSREEWITSWIREIAELLKLEGIYVSRVKTEKVKKTINKNGEDRWSGSLTISNSQENIKAFINNIGCVYSVGKRQKLNEWIVYQWHKQYWEKASWKKNRKIRSYDLSVSSEKLGQQLKLSASVIKYHRNLYHPIFSGQDFSVRELIDKLTVIKPGYIKLPILKNVPPKLRDATVYNLTSSASHRFFGNGCLTHNCFDESDLLSAGDIDSALAIITNFPDATVWMSSTPTGRRERFFDVCFSRNFREFHYPSQVNPNWTEELETLYREQLTEDGYRHEIAADFGEQEEGVYQFKYIQAAQEEYMYGDFRPDSRWIYTIGVDWNDIKIGTTIAVTGYNPVDKKFYLVHKEIVSRADRTQLSACQKVADLNRIWRPQHIYVDAGYGTVQVEVLHDYGNRALVKYGPKHPDATLRDRVKAYDFGGTIEVRDLFTKQIIKKPAKPFLVENSVRRFENYEFRFPKTDERFTAQLSGYIVDRITASGRPTYKQQNEKVGGDHMIDAVNLALVAFTLEKTKWGKPQYDYHIAFSDGMAGSKQTGREAIHQPQQIAGSRTQELVREKSIFAKEENILPVSNTSQPKNDKIWSWPGFGHDAPRPQQKQIKYSRLTPRTRSRPARKKW